MWCDLGKHVVEKAHIQSSHTYVDGTVSKRYCCATCKKERMREYRKK